MIIVSYHFRGRGHAGYDPGPNNEMRRRDMDINYREMWLFFLVPKNLVLFLAHETSSK